MWSWPKQRLDNDVFRIALLRRAAALVYAEHSQCQMQFSDDGSRAGERCLQPMHPRRERDEGLLLPFLRPGASLQVPAELALDPLELSPHGACSVGE